MARSNSPDDHSNEPHPLDELFIVGAKYHEPSAAEREAAAKEAQREAKKLEKQRQKDIERTKRVLGGGGGDQPRFGRSPSDDVSYNNRTATIGLVVIVVVAALLSQTSFL